MAHVAESFEVGIVGSTALVNWRDVVHFDKSLPVRRRITDPPAAALAAIAVSLQNARPPLSAKPLVRRKRIEALENVLAWA